MLKFLINCGIWIIPIIICFVVSIFIIIERIIFYSSINKNQDKIVSDIRELVAKGNYDGAKEYCRAVGTPLASIMKKAIELHDLPVAEIREGVTNEATLQMPRMERLQTFRLCLVFWEPLQEISQLLVF